MNMQHTKHHVAKTCVMIQNIYWLICAQLGLGADLDSAERQLGFIVPSERLDGYPANTHEKLVGVVHCSVVGDRAGKGVMYRTPLFQIGNNTIDLI